MNIEELKRLGEKWANLPACAEVNEIADECMEELPQLLSKIEQLEKACAEMRSVLELFNHAKLRVFFTVPERNAIDHAISTSCGEHYIHRDEVRPLVEALEKLLIHSIEFYNDWKKGDFELCKLAQYDMGSVVEQFKNAKQALTHAENLLKGETK